MNKGKKWLVFVVLGIIVHFVVIFSLLLLMDRLLEVQESRKIFTDLSAWEKLEPYVTKDLDLASDRYLQDLAPTENWTKEVRYEGKTYTVFAYVFSTEKDAAEYWKRIQNREPLFGAFDYYWGAHTTWQTSNAIHGKNVYRIYGRNWFAWSAFSDFTKYATEDFPVDLAQLPRETSKS
jgi:hypothetical protein